MWKLARDRRHPDIAGRDVGCEPDCDQCPTGFVICASPMTRQMAVDALARSIRAGEFDETGADARQYLAVLGPDGTEDHAATDAAWSGAPSPRLPRG